MATRDVFGQQIEPLPADFAAAVDEQCRADLDDKAPRRSERRGGRGRFGVQGW
jgi:hypothetical protein